MPKIKTELNEILLEAISANVDSDWDDLHGGPRNFYNAAANETEIICLEEQIKLLAKIKGDLHDWRETPFALIQIYINRLQNQIETITSLI